MTIKKPKPIFQCVVKVLERWGGGYMSRHIQQMPKTGAIDTSMNWQNTSDRRHHE